MANGLGIGGEAGSGVYANQLGLGGSAGSGVYGSGGVSGSIKTATYTVKSGDTFSKIASKFGMSIASLKALNPQVSNINVINIGQVLRVSGSGSLGIGGTIGVKPVQVVTKVDTNTGQVSTTNTVTPVSDQKNWFDKTFFDGAGALTGTAIAVLVVLGVIVISKRG